MTVKCWRCERTLYVVEGTASGRITKTCERCKAKNVVVLDALMDRA